MIWVLRAHSERNTKANKLSQSDGQTPCEQAVAIIGISRLDSELLVGERRAQVLLFGVVGLCRLIQAFAGRPLGIFAHSNHCVLTRATPARPTARADRVSLTHNVARSPAHR
jgi:hypothetical protein